MASLQFGLSLDPSVVPQRHCFYDSDEEDAESDADGGNAHLLTFSGAKNSFKTPLLLVCTSPVSSAFARCFFSVKKERFAAISCTSASEALQGRYFSAPRPPDRPSEAELVTTFLNSEGEAAVVCAQEQQLKIELCNAWAEMVMNYIFIFTVIIQY